MENKDLCGLKCYVKLQQTEPGLTESTCSYTAEQLCFLSVQHSGADFFTGTTLGLFCFTWRSDIYEV